MIAAARCLTVLVLIVLAPLACRGTGDEERATAPTPASTAVPEVPAGDGGGRSDADVPIHAVLSVDPLPPAPDRPFVVTMSVVADVDTARARGVMSATGTAQVVDAAVVEWNGIDAGRRESATATLRLVGTGPGEIRGSVEVLAADGSVGYSRTATLDVVVTPTEVLTGTNGPLALGLQHLDHERAAGRITDEQYRQQREELLGAN